MVATSENFGIQPKVEKQCRRKKMNAISKCCGFPANVKGNTTSRFYVCSKCEKPCDAWEGWHIKYNPKPIPDRSHDFDVWHDDLENIWTAASREDGLYRIEEIEKEM
jgi:hypothetical protein